MKVFIAILILLNSIKSDNGKKPAEKSPVLLIYCSGLKYFQNFKIGRYQNNDNIVITDTFREFSRGGIGIRFDHITFPPKRLVLTSSVYHHHLWYTNQSPIHYFYICYYRHRWFKILLKQAACFHPFLEFNDPVCFVRNSTWL